jgi:tetratricopeptide (TPR) repeat protein
MEHRSRFMLMAASTAILVSCGRSAPPPPAPHHSLSPSCEAALAPGATAQPIDRAISELQEQARHTQQRETLELLGYRFITKARVANDPGAYTLVERVATCIDEQHPGDVAAMLLRGHALHQLHRFHEAEAIARTLVTKREFVLDYALLGDVLMEQGRLTEAAVAYQKMIDLKPFYQSYTRAAHLRWLTGDLDGAIALMHLAIAAASPRDPEAIAWAYTRLGAYELQRADLDRATRAIDAALSFQPQYPPALLARGRVLLTENRLVEAVAVLERAASLNPLPEYQWILSDALRHQGREQEAIVIERQLIERGPVTDPRTVALFLATRRLDSRLALALSEHELAVRRDVFTEDARGWALASAGRFDEARDAMDRALSAHTNDARLFLHAGVIASAAGRQANARRWFTQAERLRSTLLPSELDILRGYRHPVQNATGF